jgi:hypothetical protein
VNDTSKIVYVHCLRYSQTRWLILPIPSLRLRRDTKAPEVLGIEVRPWLRNKDFLDSCNKTQRPQIRLTFLLDS